MADAAKRTMQQQRIQELQEQLELYNNAAASRVDPNKTNTATAAAAEGKRTGAYSSSILGHSSPLKGNSSNRTSNYTGAKPITTTAATRLRTEALSPMASNNAGPAAGSAPENIAPVPTAAVPTSFTTVTRSSASAVPQPPAPPSAAEAAQAPSSSPSAPAPAPRLARSLAEDFCSSAGTSPAPSAPDTLPNVPSSAAAATATSPLRASDVFGYYEGSEETEEEGEEEDNADGEYNIEEFDEETSDYSEEDEQLLPPGAGGHTATLDNALRRVFRAYGSSPNPHEGSGQRTTTAAESSAALSSNTDGRGSGTRQPSFPSSASSAAPKDTPRVSPGLTAAAAAAAIAAGASPISISTHPLIQRAAELYRQHRLSQQHQQHVPSNSPFTPAAVAAAAGTSGSLPRHAYREDDRTSPSDSDEEEIDSIEEEEEDEGSVTTSSASTSSSGYVSPAAAYASLVARTSAGSSSGTAASSGPATAPPYSLAAVSATAPVTDASSFNKLEAAYRQLLLLQRGVEYATERTGPQNFPHPLPHQDKARQLAEARDVLMRKDADMRAAPPTGPSLEEIHDHEGATLESTLVSITTSFDTAMKALQPVMDRGALVESKMRLLLQRETELKAQRDARAMVEGEVATRAQRMKERVSALTSRETAYAARLQHHDGQQRVAQEQIGEVEQLSKKVSSWLGILEERDRRLAGKEKRLQHVQADLLRRNEDVNLWKRATQRVKQIPPPPSPTAIR